MAVKLRTVRLGHGVRWVRQGFRVFLRQPLGFASLFAITVFGALVLASLPYIGPVVALTLMPVATLAFMFASQEVLNGRPAHPGLLLVPVKREPPRQALLQLGGAYAVTAIALVLIAQLIDGGKFAAAMDAIASGNAEAEVLRDPAVALSMLMGFGFGACLSLVYWHAPALVYWGQLSWGKAIFFSMVACWRALGAFVVYGLTWLVVIIFFTLAIGTLFGLLGAPPQATGYAVLPVTLLFSTVYYASLYFTFVDSFEITRDAPEPETVPPSGT